MHTLGEYPVVGMFPINIKSFSITFYGTQGKGNVYITLYKSDGSLLSSHILKNIQSGPYGFMSSKYDIAGFSIYNNDVGGLAIYEIRYGDEEIILPDACFLDTFGDGVTDFFSSYENFEDYTCGDFFPGYSTVLLDTYTGSGYLASHEPDMVNSEAIYKYTSSANAIISDGKVSPAIFELTGYISSSWHISVQGITVIAYLGSTDNLIIRIADNKRRDERDIFNQYVDIGLSYSSSNNCYLNYEYNNYFEPINFSIGSYNGSNLISFYYEIGGGLYIAPDYANPVADTLYSTSHRTPKFFFYSGSYTFIESLRVCGDLYDAPIFYFESSNSVNEGQTLQISLYTPVMPYDYVGSAYPYTITGISSADINGDSLTGEFIIPEYDVWPDPAEPAIKTFTITADLTTEGTETLVITLDTIPGISKSITINDTST